MAFPACVNVRKRSLEGVFVESLSGGGVLGYGQ